MPGQAVLMGHPHIRVTVTACSGTHFFSAFGQKMGVPTFRTLSRMRRLCPSVSHLYIFMSTAASLWTFLYLAACTAAAHLCSDICPNQNSEYGGIKHARQKRIRPSVMGHHHIRSLHLFPQPFDIQPYDLCPQHVSNGYTSFDYQIPY